LKGLFDLVTRRKEEEMIEAQCRINEDEIAFEIMGFNVAMLASNMATSNDEDYEYFDKFRKEVQGPGFQVILMGNSLDDFEYKKQVLQRIISETKGKSLEAVEDPRVGASAIWRCVRITASIRECFRAGGAFTAVLGGSHPYAEEIHYLEKVLEVKKEWIKKGVFRDDGGEYLQWPHEHGHLGHAECLVQFNKGLDAQKAVADLSERAIKIAIDSHYGVPHRVMGTASHERMGPHASNYHLWMKKLKKTFDPNEASDPIAYISGKEQVP
jgi:hypothetical protein